MYDGPPVPWWEKQRKEKVPVDFKTNASQNGRIGSPIEVAMEAYNPVFVVSLTEKFLLKVSIV